MVEVSSFQQTRSLLKHINTKHASYESKAHTRRLRVTPLYKVTEVKIDFCRYYRNQYHRKLNNILFYTIFINIYIRNIDYLLLNHTLLHCLLLYR